jgi:hypothetical protein
MLAAEDNPRNSEDAEPAPKWARLESSVVQRECGGASSVPKKLTASWSTGGALGAGREEAAHFEAGV